MQIKFVTRSGTNTLTGSGYEYYRQRHAEREHLVQQPRRRRQGQAEAEPVRRPLRRADRHPRAASTAGTRRSSSSTTKSCGSRATPRATATSSTRTAQSGIYSYTTSAACRQSTCSQLAAANGQLATLDPDDRQAAGATSGARPHGGSLAAIDSNLQRYSFNVPVESKRRYPTVRIDYNLTDKHRFSSAWNYNWFTDYPDTLNNFDAQLPRIPGRGGPELGSLELEQRRAIDARRRTWSTRRASATAARR